MKSMLGARKERRTRIIKRLALCSLILFIAGGGLGYIISIDPEKSTKPLDIVRGTGTDQEGFQLVFNGPSELEVKWDEVMGHALSCTQISGWIRNNSTKDSVRFKSIACRVRNNSGDIIWDNPDIEFLDRYGPGQYEKFMLEPNEYIDFIVFPLCTTEASSFELVIVDAEVIGR